MIDRERIRWVFFDVGDTLLSEDASMGDWCRQVAAELTRRGRATTGPEVWAARERAYAEFAPRVLDRILEILSFTVDATVFDAAKYQHVLERPSDGASEVLELLAGRYSLGVIANQARGTAERICERGWAKYFSVCVSSTEEGLRKPDPAFFRLALERAGCTPGQAVMIGDRIDNDIRPAKGLGMATIRIRQGLSRIQEPRETADQPDATITTLRQLPSLLL